MVKEDCLPGHVPGTDAVAFAGICPSKTHAALLGEKLRDHMLSSSEDLGGV